MTPGDLAGQRIRRRLAQIADRLSELHARSHEMSESPSAPEQDRDRLLRAAGHASQARAHAAEAARLALAACLHSAQIHDRVADLYERLAATGSGDIGRYRRQAAYHRMLAVKDRNSATSHHRGAATSGVPGPGRSGPDDRAASSG